MSHKIIWVLSILASCGLLLNSNLSFGQTTSNYGAKRIVKTIENELGVEYKVSITLPSKFNPQKQYDVIYYTDEWWLSELVPGAYAIQHLGGKTRPTILVGVYMEGDEYSWHKQRTYDLTPTPYDVSKMKFAWTSGSVKVDSLNTGGGSAYLNFFEHTIIPTVESEYRVNAKTRGFIGHSLGGLWGCYALFTSTLFNNYIIISPALWWNKGELIDQDALSKLNRSQANVFMSVGQAEIGMMKKPVEKLDEYLKGNPEGLNQYVYKVYELADHNSILPQAIYDGIALFYPAK